MKNKATLWAILTVILLGLLAWGIVYVIGLRSELAKSSGKLDAAPQGAATSSDAYLYERTSLSIGLRKGFMARLIPDNPTDILVIESATDSAAGYQIAITPWDEPADALTFARIQKDLPELKLSDTKAGALPIGSLALSFEIDQDGDRTREVWFVHKGYLYQMSAPAKSGETLDDALGRMSFKK